jgi:hypothetical protein
MKRKREEKPVSVNKPFIVERICANIPADVYRREIGEAHPELFPFQVIVKFPSTGNCSRCQKPHYKLEGNSLLKAERRFGLEHDKPCRWICESSGHLL